LRFPGAEDAALANRVSGFDEVGCSGIEAVGLIRLCIARKDTGVSSGGSKHLLKRQTGLLAKQSHIKIRYVPVLAELCKTREVVPLSLVIVHTALSDIGQDGGCQIWKRTPEPSGLLSIV
jgi:hypothetical protein